MRIILHQNRSDNLINPPKIECFHNILRAINLDGKIEYTTGQNKFRVEIIWGGFAVEQLAAVGQDIQLTPRLASAFPEGIPLE